MTDLTIPSPTLAPPPDLDLDLDLDRPVPAVHARWRDQLATIAGALDVSVARLLGGAAALGVAAVVGWRLLAPPPPTPDMQLPFADPAALAADTAAPAAGTPAPADVAVPEGEVVVHVVGAVTQAGVEHLPAGSRVVDAARRSGGHGTRRGPRPPQPRPGPRRRRAGLRRPGGRSRADARGVPGVGGRSRGEDQPQHRVRRRAGRAPGRRPGDGPGDHRGPRAAPVRVGRRLARRPRHRRGQARRAAATGRRSEAVSDRWAVALLVAVFAGAVAAVDGHVRRIPLALAAGALAAALTVGRGGPPGNPPQGRRSRRPAPARPRPSLVCVAAALLAASLAQRSLAGLARPLTTGPMTGEVTLVGDPDPNGHGGVTADVRLGGRRLRATAEGAAAAALDDRLAGERVTVVGAVEAPGPDETRLRYRHLAGRLQVTTVVGWRAGDPVSRATNGLRRTLAAGADVLPPRQRALLAGVTLGDDRDQPPDMTDAFRAAGLTHLLAVSGQNLAFATVIVAPLLARLRLAPRLMATMATLGAFAILRGPSRRSSGPRRWRPRRRLPPRWADRRRRCARWPSESRGCSWSTHCWSPPSASACRWPARAASWWARAASRPRCRDPDGWRRRSR